MQYLIFLASDFRNVLIIIVGKCKFEGPLLRMNYRLLLQLLLIYSDQTLFVTVRNSSAFQTTPIRI